MKRYLPALIPAALCVALFGLTVFWLILPRIETVVLENQKKMAQHLTHTAWSVLESYHRQVQAGVLTRTQAQAESLSSLRTMRHGPRDQDYFWINDMHPTIIMHPNLPDVIGQDVTDFRDDTGGYVFRDVVRIVREKGSGWLTYKWRAVPGNEKEPLLTKIAYVKGFEPWGWVVGTGIYMPDVRADQARLTKDLTLVGGGVVVLVAILTGYLVWRDMRIQTRREAAEKALTETENRSRILVEQSPVSIEIYDLDGTQRSANAAWAKLWDVEPDVVVDSFNILRDPQAVESGFAQAFERAVAGEIMDLKPVEYDPARSGNPGRPRTLHSRLSPLWGTDGQVQNVVISNEDITDLAKAEEEREKQVKLEGAMELAGSACHELNQPLQALVANTELLKLTLPKDKKVGKYLNASLNQIDRLADITRRLQNITQYETMEYAGRTKIIDLDKASEKD